jgi:glutamate synthase (NADPH/NADH) small chain
MFMRAALTGKRIAVVGAGPAGLSCAHRAALLGHEVVVFDANDKPGGLNEYGLATYKTTDGFAQKEIDWLLSIGGIELRCGQVLGEQFTLGRLTQEFDAVFLGLGLAGVNSLGLAGEAGSGVMLSGLSDAVDFIAGLRQANDPAAVPVGRRVVVIGGGMTAIDAAVQSRKLGAQEVTIVYRRDQQRMPASKDEQEWAQLNGVTIREWSVLKSLDVADGHVEGATFATVHEVGGRLEKTGRQWHIEADTVLKAIGQTLVLADPMLQTLVLQGGRIKVDPEGRTSLTKVWAGGDCTFGGQDLTVEAVEHGKIAAHSIDCAFGIQRNGPRFQRVRRAAV